MSLKIMTNISFNSLGISKSFDPCNKIKTSLQSRFSLWEALSRIPTASFQKKNTNLWSQNPSTANSQRARVDYTTAVKQHLKKNAKTPLYSRGN